MKLNSAAVKLLQTDENSYIVVAHKATPISITNLFKTDVAAASLTSCARNL